MMPKGEDITTKFKADVSDLKKGITEANSQIKKANSEFNKASSGMDDWTKSSAGITAKLNQLKSVLEQQNSKLEIYQKRLQTAQKYEKAASLNVEILRDALKKARIEYGENSAEVKKLERELSQAEKTELSMKKQVTDLTVTMNNQEAAIEKTKKEMNYLTNSLTEVERAENTAAKTGQTVDEVLDEMNASSNKTTEGFTVMKGALASLVADGIRKAISAIKDFTVETISVGKEFESSMKQVAATMGITVEEIQNGSESYQILKDAAKECGKTTKYSASEAAEALNYLALAGYDAQKSAETLPKILNLAAAGNLDLATASDMVTDAMAALNMETKDLDKYIDEMAKTSQKSNTSVAQLGEATLTCAGTVNLANMSLETMNAELGILANNGIKGAEGGTHLRNIILSLTSPTDTAAKALKNLGIKVTDSSGNIRDMNDIMSDFNKKLDGMSDEKKTNIISTIFNKTDISAVNALIKGSGEEFSNLKMQISNCNGSAQKMADTMQDNVAGSMTKLKSKIEGIQITIYEKFQTYLKKAVDAFGDFLDEIDWDAFATKADKTLRKVEKGLKWFSENKNKVASAVKVIITAFAANKILTFTSAISKNIIELKKATLVVNTMKATTTLFAGVTKTATMAQNAQTIALNAGTVATKAFNLAWKTNPLGVVVTVVGLLTTGIYALLKATEKSIDKDNVYYESTNKLIEKHKELNDTLKDSKNSRDDLNKSAEEQGATADVLYKKIEALAGIENKTNAQKETMKSLVEKLNEIMPDLNLQYDLEKDSLNQSTNALRDNINAQKDYIKAKAAQENLTVIAQDIAKAEIENAELTKQNAQNQKAYNDVVNKRIPIQQKITEYMALGNKLTEEQKEDLNRQKKALEDVQTTEATLKEAYEESNTALEENKKTLENLNKEYNTTSNYAENLFNQSELEKKISALTGLAESAGISIPDNLRKGIEKGQYAIPQTVEQLQNLINFDSALQEAQLAGYDIPQSISDGIMNGSMSVEDAVAQVNTYVQFNNAVQKAQVDGTNIPAQLSQSIINGQTNVRDANTQMNNWINFMNALNNSEKAGTAIPENIQQGILNGQMLPAQAIEQLNATTNLEANKLPNTLNETGKTAGTGFANGILSKESNVRNAGRTLGNNAVSGTTQGGSSMGTVGGSQANDYKNNIDARQGVVYQSGVSLGQNGINGLNSNQSGYVGAGENVIVGVQSGIQNENKQSGVFSAIANFGSRLLDKLKNSLKEHSPSKATDEMGQYLLMGLGIGIEKKTNNLLRQVSDIGKHILTSLSDELSEEIEINPQINGNIQRLKSSVNTMKDSLNSNAIPVLQGTNNTTTNNNNINNFTQIINAPKSPSRIELYRQTRNLLNLKGGK